MSRLTGRIRVGVVPRPSANYTRRLSDNAYGRWSLAAICVVMLGQIAFLVFGCDWDLCADEAEYWAWSRQLDWSYYSRGPLIAWLIRLATDIAGSHECQADWFVDAGSPAAGSSHWWLDRLGRVPPGVAHDR